MRGSSCADAGVSLASTIFFALYQRAEVQFVAMDIKGAFDRAWWKGLLCHLWNVGLHGRAFELFEPISAGVSQSVICMVAFAF